MTVVVLPERSWFTIESAVMVEETLEPEQIMSRHVLALECFWARSSSPPEPLAQNLTPRPCLVCMSAKVQCHQSPFLALVTHPAIQKCRKTLNGVDPL